MPTVPRLFLAAVLLGLPTGRALTAQSVTGALGGGAAVPLGVLKDATNTGFHLLAAVALDPASLPIGIRIDGSYNRFGLSGGEDGHLRVFQATVNAVYRWPVADATRIRPYFMFGPGIYNYRAVAEGLPEFFQDDANTDIGFNAGAGIAFVVGTVGLFAEGRYHNVLVEGQNPEFLPITVGVRLGAR